MLFSHPRYRWYAWGKLRSDAVYPAVVEHLPQRPGPVLDIGCGIGLLGLFLHYSGNGRTVVGVDADSRKISAGVEARASAGLSEQTHELRLGDARDLPSFAGDVMLLDVVHYFSPADQIRLVRDAAARVAPGGRLILRDAIDDGSMRARVTLLQERFSRAIGWLRGDRLQFPTKELLVDSAASQGLQLVNVVPMFSGNPFNNHLLVWERSGSSVDQPSAVSR